MSEMAVETIHLRKLYDRKVAVEDLTLSVARGEVFGFLGPNGAGKSTSIKMLLGLVYPTSGSSLLMGEPSSSIAVKQRIGFLPEHFRFHEWLTAEEFLALHGGLYGMSRIRLQQRIPAVLDMVGLSEHRSHALSTFSKGMLQRIGLAQALIHEPDLVLLDEPTSALDPLGRRLVRTIIQELRAKGTTVFLNSHLLSEIEITCDRVAFIKQGKVLQTLDLHHAEHERITVTLQVDGVTPQVLEQIEAFTLAWHFIEDEELNVCVMEDASESTVPVSLEVTVSSRTDIPLLAQAMLASGAQLYAIMPSRPSLEQIFLDIVGTEDSGQ